eukprot:scaffold180942_cov28-Tisochrysis_lutea.AAC.2
MEKLFGEEALADCLDLAELHPHTTNLDLPVGAAIVLEPAGTRITDSQITSAVHQPGDAMRVRQEALGAQVRPRKVAVGDLAAADAKLTLLAISKQARRVGRIHNVKQHIAIARIADGEAMVDALTAIRRLEETHLDRGFGWAIQVIKRERPAKFAGQLVAM